MIIFWNVCLSDDAVPQFKCHSPKIKATVWHGLHALHALLPAQLSSALSLWSCFHSCHLFIFQFQGGITLIPAGRAFEHTVLFLKNCGKIHITYSSPEKEWQPTPVLLPGKSHGWRSLVGYSPWARRVGHNLATEPPSASVHHFSHYLL